MTDIKPTTETLLRRHFEKWIEDGTVLTVNYLEPFDVWVASVPPTISAVAWNRKAAVEKMQAIVREWFDIEPSQIIEGRTETMEDIQRLGGQTVERLGEFKAWYQERADWPAARFLRDLRDWHWKDNA